MLNNFFKDMEPYLPPANSKTVLNSAEASEAQFLQSLYA
jgi:hypothetical protein